MANRSSQPITVVEYERMIADGRLTAEDHVELIEGVIVAMTPTGFPHSQCVDVLTRSFARQAPDEIVVRVQHPVRLTNDSMPQPDLALVTNQPRTHHPRTEDTILLIEVSDSSLKWDLTVKGPLYARAGVPEYWVVDLEGRRVLRFLEPVDGAWTRQDELLPGQSLAPAALPGLEVSVDQILGPT